ncbi:MAG: bifunctional 4-hydroxy-2-oxoglutarate aldolase/2-dehydro-3-deoxy-phosphogluconate aldolase [Rickettsiella sp.]|nr:bifunctional 4-hydroxy-2-oxoglutarate aldolase/2-dehydro-3-deoxy-phosphogluconate aldolase [Rickettsiella sp.]
MFKITDFIKNRIIPVIVIDKVEHAIPLAKTLVDSGFTVLEITLRTDCALEAIKQIAKKCPKAIVGAGTIINPEQLSQVKAAGAKFAVSPGLSKQLVSEAKKQNISYLPGIATVSEALLAYELGLTHVKFFPAESMGGIKTLSAISEVLPTLRFCPTGGINPNNLHSYLALNCVICIGGTWMAPFSLIQKGNFEQIASEIAKTQNILKKFCL